MRQETIIEDLKALKNMSYDEKERLLRIMPKKGKAYLFARYASKDELSQLVEEWDRLGKVEDIRALSLELRRLRSPFRHPALIR